MMFSDRTQAGERLAAALAGLPQHDCVLGIPRGGVVVALAVAQRLQRPLDVVVPRKLGAPINAELAIGAVAIDGTTVLDRETTTALGVTEAFLNGEIARQLAEIQRRLHTYRGKPKERDVAGRACIVVDDGLATGATAHAAVASLKNRGAATVTLAVPVGSRQAIRRLRLIADRVVCLETPAVFVAVGQWYEHFDQTSDAEVIDALAAT